jgi:ESS family glutamate:Na+ symporter
MDIRSLKMDQFLQISDLHFLGYLSAVYLYCFLTDARFLVTKHKLKPAQMEPLDVGIADEKKGRHGIDSLDFLDAIFAIQVSVIFGITINEGLENIGLKLPLFVTCLFAGILITNLIPKSFLRSSSRTWPSRTSVIALIADVSLGCFLAMSLMSMQLWTLIDLAGPIFTILGAQFLIAVSVTLFVVFPLMGVVTMRPSSAPGSAESHWARPPSPWRICRQ